MKVLKFGGTSVANAERFLSVADIIEANAKEQQTAIVLSAPAKVTNHLVDMINKAINKKNVNSHFTQLETIFETLILSLKKSNPHFAYDELLEVITHELSQIKSLIHGIELLSHCPESVHAAIVSKGEKLSISIMAKLLLSKNHKITIINPVESLLASGNHLESTVDIAESIRRIESLFIPKDNIILMPGFTAGNKKGELVLLGRNGSDYSAAVLAACLKASVCEIWTDVDGIYTCDPKLVPDAKLLAEITYQEAMELSYFGAKVLHPRTIAPIAQFQIPCLIKNTHNPKAKGTLISTKSSSDKMPVKGITNLSNMAMINVSGPGLKGMVGMSAKIFSVISSAGISVALITQSSSEYSISFCIPQAEVTKAKEALMQAFYLELKDGLIEPLDIIKNLAIISVVGDGMRTLRGVCAHFFMALAKANINIVAIAQGASERSISAVIDNNAATMGLRVVHQMLLNTNQVLDVFVIGVGGVGGALINQIARQQPWLKQKNLDLRVCGLFNSKKAIFSRDGIVLDDWQNQLKQSNTTYNVDSIINYAKENRLFNPILVDCTSSDNVANNYANLLNHGFHIVTPNKKANTSTMAYYNELRSSATKSKRKFLYDTNVGAGLPVIENLQNLLNAGDELIKFSGILSGSLSFIFGKLDEGMSLSKATLLAKEMGFTEPDPRDDLSGTDVARKLLILAREAGLSLELEDIKIESVLPASYADGDVTEFIQKLPLLDDEFKTKVMQAQKENKVLRFVGSINDGKCEVKIEAVDSNDPLHKIKNGENALAFYTRYYQPIPLVLRGYGAGNDVTAAGVFADIFRTSSNKMGD